MKEPLRNTGKIVTKVKKNKKHVSVYIDGRKLELSEDIFTSFYLYEGKALNDEEYEKLIKSIDNEKYLSYALRLLSDHLYSEYKMREKLYNKNANKSQVDAVISHLKKQGFIDDNLFVEEYLIYASNNNIGKNKIKDNLLKKGIFQEEIDHIVFKEKEEINKANKLLPKLIKRYDKYNARSQKDHIIQSFLREGFDLDVALEVTNTLNLFDDKKEQKLLRRDYENIRSRYARKYSGRELKDKVLSSLLRKGYKGKDIFKMMGDNDEIC